VLDEEFYAEFWLGNGNLNLTKYRTFLLLSQESLHLLGHPMMAAVLRPKLKGNIV
jgi:hypothetical protein